LAISNQNLDVRPSPSSTLTKATTTASDIDVQLMQVLRKAPAFQNQDMVKEYYRMKESSKSQFTGVRMNYHVWRQRFIATVHSQQRLISDKGKSFIHYIFFYDKWKRLMGDRILVRGAKQKIVTTALDFLEGSKVQLLSLESVRGIQRKIGSIQDNFGHIPRRRGGVRAKWST
jgi:hypothetical protein